MYFDLFDSKSLIKLSFSVFKEIKFDFLSKYCNSGTAPNLTRFSYFSRISVMGGDQAAGVMATIRSDQAKQTGKELSTAELEEYKKPILEKYENEGNPYYASARLWDDGVISPVNTRKVLILALQAIKNNPIPDTQFPVFRM